MAVSIRHVDDDATLVLAAQDGDRDAFTELFRRHYPTVRRVCARRLRDLKEADEVAQAAFVKAYERIHQCDGERRFGAWVQVIAHRLCIDEARARARTTLEEEPVLDAAAASPWGPEETVLRHEREHHLHAALKALPERQREVVIARDVEGRRPGEIAAALGLTIGAVDSLLLRARRRLATQYAAASSESGLVSLPASASATVTTAAMGAASTGRLARLVQGAGDLLSSVSTNVAATVGQLPSMSTLANEVAAGIVAGVLVLAPLDSGRLFDTPSVTPPVVSIDAPDVGRPIGGPLGGIPAVPTEVVVDGVDVAPTGAAAPVELPGTIVVAPGPLAPPTSHAQAPTPTPTDTSGAPTSPGGDGGSGGGGGGAPMPPPASVSLIPGQVLTQPTPFPPAP